MAKSTAAVGIGKQTEHQLDPPWSADERQAIANVFRNPDYSKRTSVQILEAIEPFIVARVTKAREAGRGAGSWQPIETAPKDGTEIVCAEFDDGKGHFEKPHWRFWSARWRSFVSRDAGFGSVGKPSVWQELPPNPKI